MTYFRILLLTLLSGLLVVACVRNSDANDDESETGQSEQVQSNQSESIEVEMEKSEEEWREILTEEEYYILREAGTERAFSGEYVDMKEDGTYVCAGCGQELFSSDDKFDSGTGWPSYTRAIDDGKIIEKTDRSHGMVRTEVVCSRCGGHLGHVFPDGPAPTGQRFCINSAALDFDPADESEDDSDED